MVLSIKSIFAAVGMVIAILGFSEYALDPAVQWIWPSAESMTAPADGAVQAIGDAVAAKLGLPAVPIRVGAGSEIFGQVKCGDNGACAIHIKDGVLKRYGANSDVLMALLAHEYGHVKQHVEKRSASSFHYLLAPAGVLWICLCAAGLMWGYREQIAVVGVALAAGFLMFLQFRTAFVLSSLVALFAPFVFSVIACCVKQDGALRRSLSLTSVWVVSGLLFYAGVEYRNGVYRMQETEGDQVAAVIAGGPATAELICGMHADSRVPARHVSALDRNYGDPFQEWIDVHPSLADRAKILDVIPHCNLINKKG